MLTEPRGGDTAPAGNRPNLKAPNLKGSDTSVKTCPACGYQVAALFYDGGRQPAAPIEDPQTPEEARSLARPPLCFVRCLDCGHVFHGAFTPLASSAYRRWPKLNDEGRKLILDRIPARPSVVEIGSDDGAALETLAAAKPGGSFVAFDACRDGDTITGAVQLRREPFLAAQHLAELKPDLLLIRHILEQTADPAGLLQELAFAAALTGIHSLVYLEVSCADRALESGRVEDFRHTRRSLFTTESFSRMLARCFPSLDAFGHAGPETVYACVRLKDRAEHIERARRAKGFAELAAASRHVILLELANLYLAGKTVAVWGTGGSATAFLNAYHMDAQRFPLVIDSDDALCDTYVPGTGQRVQSRRLLAGRRLDTVIVCSPARARDVIAHMAAEGIRWERVLIRQEGRLADIQDTGTPFESTADLLLAAG